MVQERSWHPRLGRRVTQWTLQRSQTDAMRKPD
jgi:hypothetical protein